MQTKTEILTTLQRERNSMRQFGVGRVGIFGSYNRGEQTERSDLDVLVEFDKGHKTFRNLLGVAQHLESLFGNRVEVVTPESLSPYIAPHIKKDITYVQIAD